MQRPMNRVGVVERRFLAGAFRFCRRVRFCFGRLASDWLRQRRDGGRTDLFGRIQIELHQRQIRTARILLQDRARDQSRFRVDRAPSGETARQNLKRQYRCRYQKKACVGLLRAPGRGRPLEQLPEFLMRLDEMPQSGSPQDVRKRPIAVQFVVADDQAPALRRQVLRQETRIKVLNPAGESHATHIICGVCHSFHRHAP